MLAHPLRLLAAILVALTACGALWTVIVQLATTSLLRRRAPDPVDPPDKYGLAYEETHFTSRDHVKLVGWWIPAEDAIGTVIMCHGQNGSMDGDTAQALPLHASHFNVLMFDFRAHGRSEGHYVTMGMDEKEDLLGALDYLETERGVTRVGVFGFSMGAVTALLAAALSDHIAVLVCDSPFAVLGYTLRAYLKQRGIPYAVARSLVQAIIMTASWRAQGRIDQTSPLLWMEHISPRPILFICGKSDPFVLASDIERMAQLARGRVEVWSLEGVGHRGAYRAFPDEYNRRVVEWFKQNLTGTF